MRALTEQETKDKTAPCYHCGEEVPPGLDINVAIEGESRAMCCPGCAAVASLIAESGLDQFYRQRTAYNQRPPVSQAPVDEYLVYDEPEIAAAFASTDGSGLSSASLLLRGVSCAACTWLIEQTLHRVAGIERAVVNLQQARLDIRFDASQVKLSEIFAQVAALGYQPRPFQPSALRQQLQIERREDLKRLAIAGLGMMQVGMFAIALHAGDLQGIDTEYRSLLRWVSLPVSALVVLYSARPFFTSAWRHLRLHTLVMDLPVALAIGLAFLASAWATISGTGQVYFDSVVMFTFFLLLARFIEKRMRQRYLFEIVNAEESLPPSITQLKHGQWQTSSRQLARKDDHILIRAGDTVPLDAIVYRGQSSVQEDAFNGESLPRTVTEGDAIFAGTVNMEDSLEARVTGNFQQSRLAALQQNVDIARDKKPRLARIADNIAGKFVAAVLLIATATCLFWLQIDPDRALWVTLSVLVVSCPCALALATPAALTAAASALRRRGIVIRGDNALESLNRCTHVLFDKTGTLTRGDLTIQRVVTLGELEESHILEIAAGLQLHSAHPLARAFRDLPNPKGITEVVNLPGAGLEGACEGSLYRLGSPAYCRAAAPAMAEPPDEELYWIGLVEDATPLAYIGLMDQLRSDAQATVAQLRAAGLSLQIVTGDPSAQGTRLGRELGIATVHRGLLPEQKMQHVKALQDEGAVVAMIGDGLNDAPVLSMADTSFAVANATDLARAEADVVIGDDLGQILTTRRYARSCLRIMRQNFAWALAYNIAAIPLAALGFVPPWIAAIGMSLSSLLVVANSLRLNT